MLKYLANSNITQLSDHVDEAKEECLLEVAQGIRFPSVAHAKAYIVACTQNLWFRAAWEKEFIANPEMSQRRWAQKKDQDSTSEHELTKYLSILGYIDEVKRPHNFMPDIILWLAAVQESGAPRIYGDIPVGYKGDVVLHSSRRGLIANKNVMEAYAILQIAECFGLANNEQALKIIETVCKAFGSYQLAYPVLQDSTKDLRKNIAQALKDNSLVKEDVNFDFSWPTEKDLYNHLFAAAQAKMPGTLGQARLVFDDPEDLPNGKALDTYTQAALWLKKQKVVEGEKQNILALSIQPHVKYQHMSLVKALEHYYNVVTVGPRPENGNAKDGLESLAKVLYNQVQGDEEIQSILPWVK